MVSINLEKRTCEKQCVLPKTYAREGAEREVGKEEPVSVSSALSRGRSGLGSSTAFALFGKQVYLH